MRDPLQSQGLLDRLPFGDARQARQIETEQASTALKLVVAPVDGQSREMAAQERSDSAVPDKENVARQVRLEDRLDLCNDPALRIHCAFPASDAVVRFGEEAVGNRFELDPPQVPGR